MEDRYNVAGVASGHIECAGYEWGLFIYIYIRTEEGWRIGTTWRVWSVGTSSERGMSGGRLYIHIGTEEGWRIGTMWRVWPVDTSSVRGMR